MVSWRCSSESRLSFLNFQPLNLLWPSLARKSQSCSFCLKIGTYGISSMLILIPTLFFWIWKPKSIFGQIWVEKVKTVHFDWKLPHRVSRGCSFLFQHYFPQFPTLNPFLDKCEKKNSKFIMTYSDLHCYHRQIATFYQASISYENFWIFELYFRIPTWYGCQD